MTLPHSMDYLMNGGVLDFDAAAYLNNSNTGGVGYNTNMLGGVQMQAQPKRDGFVSKAKSKMSDVNFLKKATTVALVTVLTCVGLRKCKNLISSMKNSEAVSNALGSEKKGVCNFFKNIFKK